MTRASGPQIYDSQGRRKYINAKEGKRFLAASGSLEERERLLCEVLYYTGCRISEALALEPQSIDGADSVVRIFTLKRRKKVVIRRVPIPAPLVKRLLSQDLEATQKLWDFSRMSGWRIVKVAMAEAKISGVQATCKGLRHGFGVRAAMAGLPVTLIQRWMGHASPTTTAIYLDVRGDEERQLMSRTWK